MLEAVLVAITGRGGAFGIQWVGARMPLNISQRTDQLPATKAYPAHSGYTSEAGKPRVVAVQ